MGQQMKYRDRVAIEYQIDENPDSSLRSVAERLGVARSTVLREITSNSTVMPSKSVPFCKGSKGPGDGGECPTKGRWPYCCNRCAKTNCPKERLFYRADEAERLSKARNAKSARKPSKRTLERASVVESAVSPLIKKGISIEAAARSSSCDVHPTTIRRWIDRNLISPDRTDLPRAAKFYCKRLYDYSRKRSAAPARIVYGRTIEDYAEWMSKGKRFAVQVDTVIGKNTDSHCVLTVMDPKTKLQVGVRIRKTADSVNKAILEIYDAFSQCGFGFDTILTDNGTEFQRLIEIENTEDGVHRFNVYYCDPYNSSQKADCERNHEFARYGLKKGESVEKWDDAQILDLFSKVNSYPRRSLGWLSPFQALKKSCVEWKKLIGLLGMGEMPLSEINFKKK